MVQVCGSSEERVLILINSELYCSGVAWSRGADAPTSRGKTHRDVRAVFALWSCRCVQARARAWVSA